MNPLRRYVPKLAFLLLLQCVLSVPALATEPDALLWKASKNGFRIFLFGTTHQKTNPTQKLPSHVRKAFEESDVILTENSELPEVRRANLPAQLKSLRRNYGRDGYAVNSETKARLQTLVDDGKLDSNYVNRILHWSPLSLLWTLRNSLYLSRAKRGENLSWAIRRHLTGDPYDEQIAKMGISSGKKVYQMETIDIIHRLWAQNCENEANNSLLINSEIDAASDDDYGKFGLSSTEYSLVGDYSKLVRDTHSYDSKYASASLFLRCQHTPRNHLWINRIESIRNDEGGGAFFMVAGYRHFLPESPSRDESMLDLLARQGFTIERILAPN